MIPELSVIVPAYNAGKTLEKCLAAIRASTYQRYEVIVADDGSTDNTPQIAERFADLLVRSPHNRGRYRAHRDAVDHACGKIVVSVDSDVLIFPETLAKIAEYFGRHPEIAAVTGLCSKKTPFNNFMSQYKNLYMHERFCNLPERITFLYGSLYAVRRCDLPAIEPGIAEVTYDTALGQELTKVGKKVVILRDLEVIHLKQYSLKSWIKNDFEISCCWASLFVRYRAWRQIGKNGTAFAHASFGQAISLFLTPAILLAALLPVDTALFRRGAYLLTAVWFVINQGFVFFLFREKGLPFALSGMAVTFLDHLVMFCGCCVGGIRALGDRVPLIDAGSRKGEKVKMTVSS